MTNREIDSGSTYADRLIKVIPGEFVAAFLAINSAIRSSSLPEEQWHGTLLVSGLILLILLPVYSRLVLHIGSKKQIVASMISFVIWITSMQDVLTATGWYHHIYSTIAIIVWTLASPILVKK